jgi:hypothetical protein
VSINISVRTEQNGTIGYKYHERIDGKWRGRNTYKYYRGEGTVPTEVVTKGKDAIRSYIEDLAKQDIAEQKLKDQTWKEKRNKVKHNLSGTHKNQTLTGTILWSEKEEGFVVQLESPTQAVTYWGYGEGFGASMAGTRKFVPGTFTFTPEAIQNAKSRLIELYEKSLPTHIEEDWEC